MKMVPGFVSVNPEMLANEKLKLRSTEPALGTLLFRTVMVVELDPPGARLICGLFGTIIIAA